MLWHEQVQVEAPNGDSYLIDKRIRKMIKEFWKKGIPTRYSCQGGGEAGYGYILISDCAKSRKFVRNAFDLMMDDPECCLIIERYKKVYIVRFQPNRHKLVYLALDGC